MAIRALGDTGAQLNLINVKGIEHFRFPTSRCDIVLGMAAGSSTVKANSILQADITTLNGAKLFSTTSVVAPEILSRSVPQFDVSNVKEILPDHISQELADPTFFRPAPIDVLLGAEACARLLKSGIFLHEETGLFAQNSLLGWFLFGGLKEPSPQAEVMLTQMDDLADLNKTMLKFWEIEEVNRERLRTPEEEKCEEIFNLFHKRTASGKFVVPIPLRDKIMDIGSSRDIALKRFHQLERRFVRDPELKEKYCATMADYLQLGHLKKVNRPAIGWVYRSPHHAVTQKFRIVFDASC